MTQWHYKNCKKKLIRIRIIWWGIDRHSVHIQVLASGAFWGPDKTVPIIVATLIQTSDCQVPMRRAVTANGNSLRCESMFKQLEHRPRSYRHDFQPNSSQLHTCSIMQSWFQHISTNYSNQCFAVVRRRFDVTKHQGATKPHRRPRPAGKSVSHRTSFLTAVEDALLRIILKTYAFASSYPTWKL